MLTTADYLFTATIYVGFRSPRPGILTWLRVLKGLLENKIDIRNLAKWGTKDCLSSTVGGISPYRQWHRKRKITFCNFKHSGQLNIYLVCNRLYKNYELNSLKYTQNLVPFPHISPKLDTKLSNGIYTEIHVARCIWRLPFSMNERGSVILKGEVHSLLQSILLSLSFHASHSVGSGRSFCREYLSDVDINCTSKSIAVVQIALKCKLNPYYFSTLLVSTNFWDSVGFTSCRQYLWKIVHHLQIEIRPQNTCGYFMY